MHGMFCCELLQWTNSEMARFWFEFMHFFFSFLYGRLSASICSLWNWRQPEMKMNCCTSACDRLKRILNKCERSHWISKICCNSRNHSSPHSIGSTAKPSGLFVITNVIWYIRYAKCFMIGSRRDNVLCFISILISILDSAGRVLLAIIARER